MVSRPPNGVHVVTGEGLREHLDELENRLKTLVNQVPEVLLHLLRSLNVHKVHEKVGHKVNFLAEIILAFIVILFGLKAHVPANPTDFWVIYHCVVHFA